MTATRAVSAWMFCRIKANVAATSTPLGPNTLVVRKCCCGESGGRGLVLWEEISLTSSPPQTSQEHSESARAARAHRGIHRGEANGSGIVLKARDIQSGLARPDLSEDVLNKVGGDLMLRNLQGERTAQRAGGGQVRGRQEGAAVERKR